MQMGKRVDRSLAVGQADALRAPHSPDRIICEAESFEQLPETTRVAIRRMLDTAYTATPYHDPAFCGPGMLGGGTRFFHVASTAGDFYAFCGEHFVASRYLPFLRQVIVERGPVAATPAAFEEGLVLLRDWARRRGYVCASITPPYERIEASWMDGVAKATGWRAIARNVPEGTLLLDLRPSEDELLARFRKMTRYEIRRAWRSVIDVRRGTKRSDAAAFYNVYFKRAQEKGFNVVEKDVFFNLADSIFDNDRGALFLSEKDSELLCGAFVLRTGSRVHYVYGAMDKRRAGGLPVGYPSLWAAIKWAKSTGATEFDFGGYAADGDAGVRQFKRGFGGTEVQYLPGLQCSLIWPFAR
jgi:hypothetical protein